MNYVGDFSGLQSEKDTEVDFLLIFFFLRDQSAKRSMQTEHS